MPVIQLDKFIKAKERLGGLRRYYQTRLGALEQAGGKPIKGGYTKTQLQREYRLVQRDYSKLPDLRGKVNKQTPGTTLSISREQAKIIGTALKGRPVGGRAAFVKNISNLNNYARRVAAPKKKATSDIGYIYKVTDSRGKVYIGQTSQRVQRRLLAHKERNTTVGRLLKAGARVETIWRGSINKLNTQERSFIKKFNSTDPSRGYNRTVGGSSRRNVGGVIYKITEKKTGRVYIGQTVSGAKSRLMSHIYKDNPNQIGGIIRKKGIKNFSVDVVGRSKSKAGLNRLERQLINKYDARNPRKGFNRAAGVGNTNKTTRVAAYLRRNQRNAVKSGNKKLANQIGRQLRALRSK